jgi:hypothetical protein
MRGQSHRRRTALPLCLLATVVLPGPVQAVVAQSSGWEIEVVDDGKLFSWMTDRSLRLDAQGDPHIAYGQDHLYYAVHDGVAWHYEVADPSNGVGACASIALDGSGCPRISYSGSDDLKYAYRDALGWHLEAVDTTGTVGSYTSLTLDASGYPHISRRYHTNNDPKYARAPGPTPITLTTLLLGGQLVLSWTAVGDVVACWAYGVVNQAHLVPRVAPGYLHRLGMLSPLFRTRSSANGVGDPNANWTYMVLAVDGAEQVRGLSNRVGEHDFAAARPWRRSGMLPSASQSV